MGRNGQKYVLDKYVNIFIIYGMDRSMSWEKKLYFFSKPSQATGTRMVHLVQVDWEYDDSIRQHHWSCPRKKVINRLSILDWFTLFFLVWVVSLVHVREGTHKLLVWIVSNFVNEEPFTANFTIWMLLIVEAHSEL